MFSMKLCRFVTLLALVSASSLAWGQDPTRPTAETVSDVFRDDPLGHISPEVGAEIEEAMSENETAEEHYGLLGRNLHGRGPVSFEYLYTGEVLSNARGGLSTRRATQYEGLLDLAMLIDFDKARLPVPGKFFLLFQQTHGRGLSTDFVGDAQIVSNLDSFGNITQVSEYWWETNLGDDDWFTVRLGKQDVNGEFHLTEMAGDFVHDSYGLPVTVPASSYPHTSVGAVMLAHLSDSLEAKAGLWNGKPNGATWGFSDTGDTFAIAELEYTYDLFNKLPGVFDFGFSHLSQVDIDPETTVPEQYAVYCDFEQALWRESFADDDNEQGLGVFARYGTVFPKDEVQFKDYFGAGLVYRGLIPGRDEDILGAGVNYLRHNLGGTGTETATEVFYKIRLTPWATLQPDLQFISSPSGIYRDSLVAGMRFQIVL